MRVYVEQYHDDWWILSAKHGLLDLNSDPIEPYDETLSEARVAIRWRNRARFSESCSIGESGYLPPTISRPIPWN